MASVSDLRDGFTSQRKNREHLYAIAVAGDDAKWPVVTTEFFDGDADEAADDFCGPAQLKSEDSIGLSPCSPLFPSRPLAYRWVVADDRLWQFCFIDDRSRRGDRPADTRQGFDLLMAAIKTFELLARSAAKELRLPSTTGSDNDIATLWLACLLPPMAETRRGEFLIRRTSADVFSESVAVLDAMPAANVTNTKPESGSQANWMPDSADNSKCPRPDRPNDPTTRDLSIAVEDGLKAGKTVQQINREFAEKHPALSKPMMATAKRGERRYRKEIADWESADK